MLKLFARLLGAGALLAAVPAGAVTTYTYKGFTNYNGTVAGQTGPVVLGSATLSFTTTTQNGVIRGGDITAYEIILDTINSDNASPTVLTQANSQLLAIGNALTVTPEGLFFNFTDRANLSDFLLVQTPTIGSGGAYYCLQTDNDCTPVTTSPAAEVYAPYSAPLTQVVPIAAPRTGNIRLATLTFVTPDPVDPGSVPEPATWAMLILGFGLAGGAMRHRRRSTALSFG